MLRTRMTTLAGLGGGGHLLLFFVFFFFFFFLFVYFLLLFFLKTFQVISLIAETSIMKEVHFCKLPGISIN